MRSTLPDPRIRPDRKDSRRPPRSARSAIAAVVRTLLSSAAPLVVAGIDVLVGVQFDRAGLTDLLGADAIDTTADDVDEFRRQGTQLHADDDPPVQRPAAEQRKA